MDIYTVANELKISHKTIHDLKLKVTFYARVSTNREEQEGSIEHQIEFFTDMINNNPNWTFVPGYVDRTRGESAANRKNFMRMIEDGKSNKFDLILTKEVSRFARNTIDSLTYTRELLRAGVGVLFQNDGICTIDTDSELRLTIMSSIAADEVRKLSERVHWGQKQSIENGKLMGNGRIFGYDKVDCKLIINEKESEMVRLIYQLYATGDYSTRKIEKILYEKGYRNHNGNMVAHSTITKILQNPKYKGYYVGNKVRIVDYRTKQQKFLPEKDWIMYKDETGETVPAIVSEELWNKANAIFKERSEGIKVRERSFKDKSPLTGKIWCGADDKPYWRTSYSNSRKSGEPIYQWVCSIKRKTTADACKSFAILESELYEILSDSFKQLSDGIDTYIETFIKLVEETNPAKDIQKEIASIQKKIEAIKGKKDRLLEVYMDGAVPRADYIQKNESLDKEIHSYEQDINDLRNQKVSIDSECKQMLNIRKTLRELYAEENNMIPMDHLQDLIKNLLNRVTIYPEDDCTMRLVLSLKTGDSNEFDIEKTNSRSGHIRCRMYPERRREYIRKSIKHSGHQRTVLFIAVWE